MAANYEFLNRNLKNNDDDFQTFETNFFVCPNSLKVLVVDASSSNDPDQTTSSRSGVNTTKKVARKVLR